MSELITGSWDDESVAALNDFVGGRTEVSFQDTVNYAASINRSQRSVAGKLRHLDITVGARPARGSVFSDEQTAALEEFVTENNGTYTFAEIAENFADGEFTRAQIQGKLLSLDLMDNVRPTEKTAHVSAYSDEEVAIIAQGVGNGDSLEAICAALGGDHAMNSVRGKALSMFKQGLIDSVPRQETTSESTASTDYFDGVTGDLAELTVAEIAEQLEKTPRGVKVALTRRGLSCQDYAAKVKEAA